MMKTKVVPSTLLSRFRAEGFHGRERELSEAAKPLAEKLGISSLRLHSFNETTAIYESPTGRYLRAGYEIDHDHGNVQFDQFAQVVVDDKSLVTENRNGLAKMVESILDDNSEAAEVLLQQYMERRRTIKEANEEVLLPEPEEQEETVDEEEVKLSKIREAAQKALGAAALFEVESVVGAAAKALQLEMNTMKNADKTSDKCYCAEAPVQITLQTVDTQKQSQIVGKRQEKILEDLVQERRSMTALREKEDFGEAVLKVKSLNATGELEQIGEAMSELVTSAPELMCLSIHELAEEVKAVLESADTPNWDDQLCIDIAEGAQKLATNVYASRVAKIAEAASSFWEADEEVPEDKWEAYKEVTGRLFKNIIEGEKKLANSATDLSEMIQRVSPILQDEGFRAKNTDVTAVARTLQRYVEELSIPTIQKVNEVVQFIVDYVLAEALQLDDEGNPPKDMAKPNKGNSENDPNNIVYKNYPKGEKLGPYGEPSKLLAETDEEDVEEEDIEEARGRGKGRGKGRGAPPAGEGRGMGPGKGQGPKLHTMGTGQCVVDPKPSELEYKKGEKIVGEEEEGQEVEEALQMTDDGQAPSDMALDNPKSSETDPNAKKPYKIYPKNNLGYLKDADGKKVNDIEADDMEEVKEMGDLVVPPKKTEALQLKDDGDTPADAHPKDGGNADKDYNSIPYRTYDVKKPVGYIQQAE